MPNAPNILVADDEESVRNLLQKVLTKLGYCVTTAGNGEEVLTQVRRGAFALLIMDIRMPKLDGMETFKILRLEYPRLPIIIMTAFSTVETTLDAMRLGAFDYLSKPFDIAQVKALTARALSSFSEPSETDRTVLSAQTVKNTFIGASAAMQEVFKIIGRVSASDSSVLIQGESGTGKELVARTIHAYSSRKHGPFVTVNCGAVPEGLLESEFFGHEKGSFTGALSRKIGKFEFADGGTIFLDEIGEMSPQLQVKLLRVLQEREFERVGGNERVAVNVRVLAATNQSLKEGVARKTFRSDLFYRLNVVSIVMPPLRERKEDIPLLAAYFRDRYCAKLGRPPKSLPEPVIRVLETYDWPGNVRELENSIEHAIVMGAGQVILTEDLPTEIATGAGRERAVAEEEGRQPEPGTETSQPGPAVSAAGGGEFTPGDPKSALPVPTAVPAAFPTFSNATAPPAAPGTSPVGSAPEPGEPDFAADPDKGAPGNLREALKAVEKAAITKALHQTKGNKLRAAKLLAISRRALQYKIEEYGIDTEER
ncbi:Two component system, signal transduction response regulator [Acididesulfobacillus acetoxydans]|uniref:DNA-binding transcriptional regulator NtrC n=1 Tax=Acididesulfobacillus acetoxydans TaxID=1561005 RepID=A0A8S0Y349_9FIRM|nr:sigma-54 dependent transcriptional regulator [Acididesulfobacillus acetoxydans]CAA7601605.1 Two component system, signal transduction response regulator [Acididesulfobacillus acetoxydans]CEJ07092.1 Transcriptional regulatory protein ZraR [Acididesulfobacillus acetoxydans]